MMTIRAEDRGAFMAALDAISETYSEEWKAPTGYLEKANYHTNLARQNVHSTRAAFSYAAALLATGEEKDLKRAEEVLWHVAALQDKDPSNATYGIWSWYMEEPLEKMSPPDWNWADFCGKEILQVLAFHADRITHSLYVYLEETLRHACLSIYRRNMHSGYTNISIMGSYVTLHAGQLLNWPWLFDYAKRRFRKFVEYTRRNNDTFAEYNSATYTTVAIEDLTRIHDNISDPEVKAMAAEMLDVAWRTVSEHFHAPTHQWCGPNARSYTWLAKPGTLSFLEQCLHHSVRLTDWRPESPTEAYDPNALVGQSPRGSFAAGTPFVYDTAWAYINLDCPEKYRAAFTRCATHDVNLGFTTGPSVTSPFDTIAICHMEEAYALGSWVTVSAWNQRRNLLGFWGGDKPRFINATILHNLYDFSSGMFTTAQKDGHALLMASMISDGGDTHCNLDMIKDETISAYDLRMRIEIGGAIGSQWTVEGDTAFVTDGGLTIRAKLIGGEMDGMPVRLSVSSPAEDDLALNARPDLHRRFVGEEKRSYLDVVFYSGPEKAIRLSALKSVFCALYMSMDGVPCENASLSVENGVATAGVDAAGHALRVSSPARSVPGKAWKGVAALDGVPFNRIYGLPE